MTMRHDNFAVFILTHGRADNVITYETLKRQGYHEKVYIVIDNEDKTEAEYRRRYGDKVIMFDKADIAKRIDTGDNLSERKVILFARNACFEIAKDLGLDYFLELDDDYDYFAFRKEVKGVLTQHVYCKNLDKVFDIMLDFLDESGALTVAFAQGGDFIGGVNSTMWREQLTRKAMNSFFCRTDNPVNFFGRINEDVNTYVGLGSRGKLFFSTALLKLHQKETQSNSGGMTEVYLDSGTYLKSFYSVMYNPSCVKIATMGNRYMRIHHHVYWNNCAPKIINEKYKKN